VRLRLIRQQQEHCQCPGQHRGRRHIDAARRLDGGAELEAVVVLELEGGLPDRQRVQVEGVLVERERRVCKRATER
jgi:hypothetical protein